MVNIIARHFLKFVNLEQLLYNKKRMECKFEWEDESKEKVKKRKYRDNSYTLTYPSDKIREIKF